MTNKNIYPNKYTEQQTTQSVGFKGLSNLKYINSSYAQSSEVIKGKKHTPNKPARLILSNFKAQIPTGSIIQSLTVHYRHQTIPKNQGKYPNFSAPQIHLQGVKNTAIKGTAPTKDAKINKVTFKLSSTTTQINSTDFAVVFDYPANSNENEGYLRLYYVYITVTYKTSAFKLNPDLAIALDVTLSGDHPGIKPEEAPVVMGKGPAIILADASGRGILTQQSVKDLLINAGDENDIDYQLEVSDGGTTDGTAIHLTREGIPTGVLSVPTRYIHTPVSVCSMDDVESTIQLIVAAINGL